MIEFCKLVSNADDAEFDAKLGEYVDLDETSRASWRSRSGCRRSTASWCVGAELLRLPAPEDEQVPVHPVGPGPLVRAVLPDRLAGAAREAEHQAAVAGGEPVPGAACSRTRRSRSCTSRGWRSCRRRLRARAVRTSRWTRSRRRSGRRWRRSRSARLARFDKVVAGEALPPEMTGFGPPPGAGGGQGGAPGGPGGGRGGFMPPGLLPAASMKPIKGFVAARSKAVTEQLAGSAEGEVLQPFRRRGPRTGGTGRPWRARSRRARRRSGRARSSQRRSWTGSTRTRTST